MLRRTRLSWLLHNPMMVAVLIREALLVNVDGCWVAFITQYSPAIACVSPATHLLLVWHVQQSN